MLKVTPANQDGLVIEAAADIGPIHCMPGDEIRLSWQRQSGHEETVMGRNIDDLETITLAAAILIDRCPGYVVGGDDLLIKLERRGFRKSETFIREQKPPTIQVP